MPEILTRVTQEFLEALWPDRQWHYHKIQRFLCVYLFVTTSLIIWRELRFDILTQIAGTLGNFAVSFMMVAALYLNFKLPCPYRTNRVMLIGGIISALIQIAFAGVGGWGLGIKLFGSAR